MDTDTLMHSLGTRYAGRFEMHRMLSQEFPLAGTGTGAGTETAYTDTASASHTAPTAQPVSTAEPTKTEAQTEAGTDSESPPPPPPPRPSLSLVIACHSHAPLQEFWDRLTGAKIAVTMACCASYCELSAEPLCEFDDFEVYSPKRRVRIYAEQISNA
ncbi:hypothetical protein B484DRAFT_97171 [Ochromonadaceae sp. CCMP2298]|nr:hypothetical protein B484DRAFT_97171 [Ochromonadaceae sp. CCMP2298]